MTIQSIVFVSAVRKSKPISPITQAPSCDDTMVSISLTNSIWKSYHWIHLSCNHTTPDHHILVQFLTII